MEWPRRTNPSAAFTTGVFFLLLLFFFFSFVKLAFVTFGSVLSRESWIKNDASCSRVLEPTHRCRLYTLADLFARPLIVLLEFTIYLLLLAFPLATSHFTSTNVFAYFSIPPLLPFVWLILIEMIWEMSAIKYRNRKLSASCRPFFVFLSFFLHFCRLDGWNERESGSIGRRFRRREWSVLISRYLRCLVVSVRATFLGRIMDNRRPPVPVVISRGVINEASLTCGLRQEVKAPVETTYRQHTLRLLLIVSTK